MHEIPWKVFHSFETVCDIECGYMSAYQPVQAKNNNFTDSVIYLNVRKKKKQKNKNKN